MYEKLNRMQFLLLKRLMEIKEPVSSQFLANSQGISSKTIRKNLKELKEILQGHGAELTSKTGFGFWLVIFDEEKFNQFLQENASESQGHHNKSVNVDRSHQIVRYLLSKNDLTRIEELDDLLYLNRTSVKQNLNRAKSILKHFDLRLTSKKRGGYKIVGSEHNLRVCINYESNIQLLGESQENFTQIYHVEKTVLSTIEKIIARLQNTYMSYNLSAYNISWLARLIVISAIRNKQDNKLDYDDEVVIQYTNRNSYYVAKQVLSECETVLQCRFFKADIILLAIGFIGFRIAMSPKESFNDDFLESRDIAFDVVQELARLNNFRYINKDLKLIEVIALHLEGLFTRSKYHFRTTQFAQLNLPPSLMARKLAFQALVYLNEKYATVINEEELNRLAMIIRPFFGRYPWMVKKVKACVIPMIDKAEGKGLAERLMRNFQNYFSQMDILELYEWESSALDTYEIVFTSYPLKMLPPLSKGTIVIHVDMYFNEEEKQRILKILANNNYDQGGLSFADMLRSEYVFSDIQAGNMEQCLDCIEAELIKKGVVYPSGLSEDLKFCENCIPSTPKDNVLILTGIKSHAPQPIISIFILKRPILWKSSNKKAQIVIYWDCGSEMVSSRFFENEFVPHLIEGVFYNQQIIDGLLKKPDYNTILEIMSKNDMFVITLSSQFRLNS